MCVFEGNVAILNVYSQQSEPKTMFTQTIVTHVFVGFLCILIGMLSYGAYGTLTQDIVLYNLPQGSIMAIIIAILYMLNIVGSISMTIQPMYCLIEKGSMKGAHGESEPADEEDENESTNNDEGQDISETRSE